MISHQHVAARFKAGESVSQIASTLGGKYTWEKQDDQWAERVIAGEKYVQHAIREVLKRQTWQG